MKIKGLNKLTARQQEHMKRTHARHVAANGTERQKKMSIVEAWVDRYGVVCVRLENGEWYHYYNDGTWG